MSKYLQIRLKIEEVIGATLLGLLIFFVFIAAVLRWVHISIVWSVDIAQFLFTWVVFLGADIAYCRNRHMGVDVLTKALNPKMQQILRIIITLIIMGFMGVVCFFGIKLCVENSARDFNTLPISYSAATISAPIGALLMIQTGVEKIIFEIKKLQGKIPADAVMVKPMRSVEDDAAAEAEMKYSVETMSEPDPQKGDTSC